MKSSDLGELIAYCGVCCADCADFKSSACPCCRKTDWVQGDECLPVRCCREKGIAFCGDCKEFPCPDMKEFYKESESHERAYRLMCVRRDAASDI